MSAGMAEAIAAHYMDRDTYICDCGWVWAEHAGNAGSPLIHAAHVAEELAKAGHGKASEATQQLDGSNAAVVSMMTGYSKSELDDLGGVPESASDLVDAALLEAARDRGKGDSGVRHSLEDVAEEFGVELDPEYAYKSRAEELARAAGELQRLARWPKP